MIMSKSPKLFTVTGAHGTADISAFQEASSIQILMLGYISVEYSYSDLANKNFKLKLKTTGIIMDAIVISATRWNQRSSGVPEKISSISAKEVQFQNPQTAADLLGTSGEVFIQKSQQGGGSPMIRGFSANRLLYVVDGVRMNTAIFRGGNLQNVISLDPQMMESTEVMFGPGSVMYGSDAIGGVMNFQTYAPQFGSKETTEFHGKAMNRFSSANEENSYHMRFNIGGKRFASMTGISFSKYGDLKMGSDGPDEFLRPFYVERIGSIDSVFINPDPRVQTPSGYSQVNFTEKLSFKASENWNIDYGFHYSETSSYPRYDRHIRYKNGNARYGEWEYGPQIWIMNNLSLSHSKEHMLFDGFMLRVAHQHFEESRISRNINSVNRELRKEDVEAYSLNLDFTKTWNEKHILLYGAESILDNVNSRGEDMDISTGISVQGPTRYPQADWSTQAVYLTEQYKPNSKLMVMAGMRFSYIHSEAIFDTTFYLLGFTSAGLDKSAITGSAGMVFTPNRHWTISTNLSSGFRAPNTDDMGKVFDSEPGSVVVPNPALGPEYAYNVDLRIMYTVSEIFRIDVSGFYTELKDAMVRRDFLLNGADSITYAGELSKVQSIQNAAQAVVYGVQAGMELKLTDAFRLLTRINYQYGEEVLDNGSKSPARHAAPWFGMSKLTYSKDRLKIQTALVYNGTRAFKEMPVEEIGKPELYAKDENGKPFSPGWYIWNIKAEYAVNEFFAINLGIDNITDQRYRPYSSGMAGAGRNFIAAFRLSF